MKCKGKHLNKLGKEADHSHDAEQKANPIYLPPLLVQVRDGESL